MGVFGFVGGGGGVGFKKTLFFLGVFVFLGHASLFNYFIFIFIFIFYFNPLCKKRKEIREKKSKAFK